MLSPDELLTRCNEFRRAGEAEELEHLIAGRRSRSKECLVARNLNFECNVVYRVEGPLATAVPRGFIASHDPRLRAVAEALGLHRSDLLAFAPNVQDRFRNHMCYELPTDIISSALAFDRGRYPDELYDRTTVWTTV